MKRVIVLLVILSFGLGVIADEIQLGDVKKQHIELKKNNIKKRDSIIIDDKAMMEEIVKYQKEKDLEDIENLWKGTVENNQVIGFALKKLATPESQRRIHSSLMSKTLSAIIAGSSFVPYAVGSDYLVQTGAFAAGRIAQNLLNKKNMPQEIPLTDTEMIELAGLVESLQDKIINAYYNYKNALAQLKETRSRKLLYGKNYAKAMDNEDFIEIAISSAQYDDINIEEYYYTEIAKKYYLELQRLAGKKVVQKLNLYQFNFNSALVGGGK